MDKNFLPARDRLVSSLSKSEYALAIDLGTTTLAVSLIDCNNKSRLASNGSMNPQRSFGIDIISRLEAAVNSDAALQEMSRLIRIELLQLAHELCETAGIAWSAVKMIATAGNPAMQHILLGLPVRSLAFPPYRPLFTTGKTVTAAELDWDSSAGVYIFPMPGGFVGGDTVAFLYGQKKRAEKDNLASSDPEKKMSASTLLIDLGTNGEMALLAGDTIWATSAAAGPAFEGGNLTCGMPALPGAVSSIRIENERVKLKVIGDITPAGMCGSAAIEAVAELLHHDIIEPGGRLRDSTEISSNLANRVINHQGANAFVIYRAAGKLLLLTQDDIRQIQLAKAAIRAGLEVLLERSCIRCQDLQEVILTGSFGAFLKPDWLKSIGIFDQGMVQITRFTPEGALNGLELALLTDDGFDSVEHLGAQFKVVPLSGTPLFETSFMRNIDFPYTE
ncbi:MAG TPA: ASKHA domain-containing protein [Desulfuromonadaceae bacterium]|jgi:uncharacterized 2Fe-2S/4Fe-4S cluster protein (DUF4445 family)